MLCGSLCDRGRVASVICKTLGGSRVLLVIDESQVMQFAERAFLVSKKNLIIVQFIISIHLSSSYIFTALIDSDENFRVTT